MGMRHLLIRFSRLLTVALLTSCCSALAEEVPISAHLGPTEGKIEGLAWPSEDLAITPDHRVLLKGKFDRPHWNLVIEDKKISLSGGSFSEPLEVSASPMRVQLRAVGPEGKTESQTLEIAVEQGEPGFMGKVKRVARRL